MLAPSTSSSPCVSIVKDLPSSPRVMSGSSSRSQIDTANSKVLNASVGEAVTVGSVTSESELSTSSSSATSGCGELADRNHQPSARPTTIANASARTPPPMSRARVSSTLRVGCEFRAGPPNGLGPAWGPAEAGCSDIDPTLTSPLVASVCESSIHNCQPGGGGPHSGRGRQFGGGVQLAGGLGQFGGGLYFTVGPSSSL